MSLKFAANQKLVANVDLQNITNPFNSFSAEESGRTINNYFEMRF